MKHLSPGTEGHVTEKVIEAVHRNEANIRGAVVPVKLAAATVTITAGSASVFGTPIADALSGIEVLYVGRILYDVMFPSFDLELGREIDGAKPMFRQRNSGLFGLASRVLKKISGKPEE